MGNSKSIESYDKKARMDESLINWLIKEFGKNANIISRAPGAGYLVRTTKKFKGQNHYYFNIPAFFDPDKGFIMCLFQMYEQYLKKIKEIENDKYISFLELLSRPFEFILSFLGWENDSKGLTILRSLYSMALGVGIGFGVATLAMLASKVHPLLELATISAFVIIELNSLKKIYAMEKIEKNGNELFSKIFENFKMTNFIYILKEINVIEIAIDESANSLLDGFFNKGVQINYWYIENIENAKTLSQLDERSYNFYCEIVKSMKNTEIKNTLTQIRNLKKKYDEAYISGTKNLDALNYCKDALEQLNQSMPNNPAIQDILKKLNNK